MVHHFKYTFHHHNQIYFSRVCYHPVNQYQAEVDVLMNNNNDIVNSVFAICKQINCKPSCLSWPTCDVSENYMSIEEWGIKEVIEIEKLLRNEIGYLTEPEWDVRYLCRLVTNIKSWGVTKYGQICSYKSTFENVTHNTLIANYSYVNVYHHRPWMVDLLSFPVIETCCSENVCTLLTRCRMHSLELGLSYSTTECNKHHE